MKLIIFGDNEKKDLEAVKLHAEENHFSFDDLLDIHNGHSLPAGDLPGFSCIIPPGIRVVYSLEVQQKGLTRHVSISKENKHDPHPEVCSFLMKELGFKTKLSECLVYREESSSAINIIEFVK